MKVLWVGDASAKTGFEYVSNGFLNELMVRDWEVVQLGINHNGDPHGYPWRVYPAGTGGDHMGLARIQSLIDAEQPDVVVLLNDSWGIPLYLKRLRADCGAKLVGYPPVDSRNQSAAHTLNGRLDLVLTPTQFGADAMRQGGWDGPTTVVGYGIDVPRYGGMTPAEARATLKMPVALQQAFIIGNINRNAPRKRIDLTLEAFKLLNEPDAYLLLHMDPLDSWGWDILQMVQYFGIPYNRIIMTQKEGHYYSDDERMRAIFASLDLQISTTVGEGWGLTTAEGMASGVAQVVPKSSALAEWADGGVMFYGIDHRQVAPGGMNTIWEVPSVENLVEELRHLLVPARREKLATQGLAHISQTKFSWETVGDQMDAALKGVL